MRVVVPVGLGWAGAGSGADVWAGARMCWNVMGLAVIGGGPPRETNIRLAGPDLAGDANIRLARRSWCA